MEIVEILKSEKSIKNNMELLINSYIELTGRKVCRTCPSTLNLVVLTLKNHYNMTQFELKGKNKMYKIRPEDKYTISNSTMTDEKAIDFLREKPSRIDLFSKYPSNWKKLVEGVEETEEEKESRLAAEAEKQAAEDAPKKEVAAEAEKQAEEADAMPTRDELLKMKLADLREKYPHIKARSTAEFVNELLVESK